MGSAAVQGRLWSMAPHDWAELQEPLALPLWTAILTAGAVGSGTRVLDAGCGAGGASRLASGWGALVNGLDAAAGLLAIARERVPEADFRQGDLAALPYPDGAFEVVIAADVLPYVADPEAALRELWRVCAPQGRLMVAVWGAPDTCDQHAVVAAARLILSRPLDGEPFALSMPGVLEHLIEQAGLRAQAGAIVACPAEYEDLEAAWLAQASAGPIQAALRVVGMQLLKHAVQQALARLTTAEGRVRMSNQYRYLVVTAPAVGAES